jgi:hypothetical protein
MMTSDVLPTTKDLQKMLALAEAEKAAESARRAAAEEAEKKSCLKDCQNPRVSPMRSM